MTDRSLDDLKDEFHAKVTQLLQNCSALGVELVPYFTRRTPQEQAVLWKQSRTQVQCDQEVSRLTAIGAQWLASVLRDAPLNKGPWATNSVPGNSWHQWGEACDCYWQVSGSANWHDGQGYVTYAAEATKLGLTSGRGFQTPDIDHVQFRSEGAPSDLFTWGFIDAQMQSMFGKGVT